MSSLVEKTRASSFFVFPSQVLSRIIGFLVVILMTRYLSVEEYGRYNLIIGSTLIFSFLTDFGISSSLQRFISEYGTEKKWSRLYKTVRFSMGFRLLSGLVVLGGAVFFFDYFASRFSLQNYKYEFVLFVIGSYVFFQIEFLQIILNSLFLHKYSSLAQIVYLVLRAALIVFFFLLGGALKSVFVAELIAYGVGCLLFWCLFVREVYRPNKVAIVAENDALETKRFVRYSAYHATVTPGYLLQTNSIDYFIVAAISDAYQLGLYSLASRASRMITSMLPQTLMQGVIRPVFYHQYYSTQDRAGELKKMFRTLSTFNAAVIWPIVAFLAVGVEPFIEMVFGAKFNNAAPAFVVLMLCNLIVFMDLSTDLTLQAIEKVEAKLYAQIFAFYNLVAAVFLMSVWGINGVALATGSALVFKNIYLYGRVKKYTGISLPWSRLGQVALNTVISAAAGKLVLISGAGPIFFLAALTVSVITYLGMTWINNFMEPYEKALVNRIAKYGFFEV